MSERPVPSWVGVREDPATYQAVCAQCGWHTVPMLQEGRVALLARLHADRLCPNPFRRSGARYSCGCWSYNVMPGQGLGSPGDCPIHGEVAATEMNTQAPRPDPGTSWIALAESDRAGPEVSP